jgi:hypothetical protein
MLDGAAAPDGAKNGAEQSRWGASSWMMRWRSDSRPLIRR